MPRQPNLRPTQIYYLIDTRTNVAFYCGKTVVRVGKRLSSHWCTARKRPNTKLSKALVNCGPENVRIFIIEIVPLDKNWADRERFRIAELRQINPNCANVANGGQGAAGYVPTPEGRAKIGIASAGRKHSAESLAKMRQPRRPKTWVFSPEHRAKLRDANKNSPKAIEALAKLHASLKGRKFSEEHRTNMSAARKRSPKAMAAALANLRAINLKRASNAF